MSFQICTSCSMIVSQSIYGYDCWNTHSYTISIWLPNKVLKKVRDAHAVHWSPKHVSDINRSKDFVKNGIYINKNEFSKNVQMEKQHYINISALLWGQQPVWACLFACNQVTKAFRKYCAQNHQHFLTVLFGLVCWSFLQLWKM